MNDSPARYDIYAHIHRALRASMATTLIETGRVDPGCNEAVERQLQSIDALLVLCSDHLEHENTYIHAAMEARRPGASHKTASDHDQHVAMIGLLTRDIERVRTATGAERQGRLQSLYQHLSSFVAENFEHMLIEESYNNAVLWDHYSDDEIRQIEGALVTSIPPDKNAIILQLMLPAIPQPERVEMLRHLRVAMPPDAFDGLLDCVLPLVPSAEQVPLQMALAA